jgi:hypothetical protein
MSAFFFVLHQGGWEHGQSLAPNNPLYLQATTACLSAVVVMQIINVFLCRSDCQSIIGKGFFSNKLIFVGIAAEIALIVLIVYTPWGNALIGTAPLSPATWLFFLPFGFGLFALEEFRKLIVGHVIPPGSVANNQGQTGLDEAGISHGPWPALNNWSVSRIALAFTARASGKRSWGSTERRSTTMPTTLGRPFLERRKTGPPLSPG